MKKLKGIIFSLIVIFTVAENCTNNISQYSGFKNTQKIEKVRKNYKKYAKNLKTTQKFK